MNDNNILFPVANRQATENIGLIPARAGAGRG